MDDVSAQWWAIRLLGPPNLQALTPKQKQVLQAINWAVEDRAAIWQQIAVAAEGDGVSWSTVFTEHPEWQADLISAHEQVDKAMYKGVRAGLDIYPYTLAPCEASQPDTAAECHCRACSWNRRLYEASRLGIIGFPLALREWIVMGLALRRRERPFRTLRDIRLDCERGMREPPLSKHSVVYAEEVSRLLREGMGWESTFYSTEAWRAQLELEALEHGEKAPKHRSPWAMQKWAQDHHLPELLAIEPELEQRQPIIEQLVAKNASLQEVIERLTPRFKASS